MPETPFEDRRPGDLADDPQANWLDDRVEAFVDGTLPADELQRFRPRRGAGTARRNRTRADDRPGTP